MAEDTWERVALPILNRIAEVETADDNTIGSVTLAAEVGLSEAEVEVELSRLLKAGYLTGIDMTGFAGGLSLSGVRLEERGARVVGVWPSTDPYEALLALLDQRLVDPNLDDETKGKLRQVRDVVTTVGKGALATVLGAYIKSTVGI